MRGIVDASDKLVAELVPPPQPGSGVCARCRSWSDSDDDDCSNCRQTADVLGQSALPVSVISLYRKPSPLREWLTGYKGRTDDPDNPYVPEYVPIVRALLGRFFLDYGAALAQRIGGYDAIVVVPSTSRQPPHPLADVIDSLELEAPTATLLQRGDGELGFRRPSTDGFRLRSEASQIQGSRILLMDDVYTTGARANSAAHTLRTAGYTVNGLLVIARRVNPEYNEQVAEFWATQSSQNFSWARSPVVNV